MTFYQYTMGGGSDYVHYGMFKTPEDDLKTASHNTVELLAELARRVSSLGLSQGKNVRVLDLGAGKGGAARYLAATFGCHVTCYNLGENQNKHNLEKAKEEGLEGLIACRKGMARSMSRSPLRMRPQVCCMRPDVHCVPVRSRFPEHNCVASVWCVEACGIFYYEHGYFQDVFCFASMETCDICHFEPGGRHGLRHEVQE